MSFPNFGEGVPQAQQSNEEQGAFGVQDMSAQHQNQLASPMEGQQPGQFGGVESPTQGGMQSQPGPDSKTTLWMGELEPWVDEQFVRNTWYTMGYPVNIKMIRDKFSGSNAGYCFVDFESTDHAARALQLNGQLIPNTSRQFKLNWASGE